MRLAPKNEHRSNYLRIYVDVFIFWSYPHYLSLSLSLSLYIYIYIYEKLYIHKIFITFSQQIINGKLLLVVIVGAKK